jgi:hypothetical protein
MFQKMLNDLRERRADAKCEGQTIYCRVCGLEARSFDYFDDSKPSPEQTCYHCSDMISKGFNPETESFPDSWFTTNGTIEFSQTLTGEQATAFEALLRIECRQDRTSRAQAKEGSGNCGYQWCRAREQLKAAFGVVAPAPIDSSGDQG